MKKEKQFGDYLVSLSGAISFDDFSAYIATNSKDLDDLEKAIRYARKNVSE